jgi:hypothetical protein
MDEELGEFLLPGFHVDHIFFPESNTNIDSRLRLLGAYFLLQQLHLPQIWFDEKKVEKIMPEAEKAIDMMEFIA